MNYELLYFDHISCMFEYDHGTYSDMIMIIIILIIIIIKKIKTFWPCGGLIVTYLDTKVIIGVV